MSKEFQVGEHVAWNSEADVSGTIIKVYTGDFDYKENMHHADARMSSNTKSRAPRPTTYDAQRLCIEIREAIEDAILFGET